MRILVIEDDADLREVLTEILSEVASHVVGAFGQEGLVWAAETAEPFDVAFTDLVSFRVYDEAAARSWVQRVREIARRVVVVTGQPSAVSTGAGVLGADLLLSKPFDVSSILAAVRPT